MDFVLAIPNNRPDEMCDDIVARFEKDPHQGDGVRKRTRRTWASTRGWRCAATPP